MKYREVPEEPVEFLDGSEYPWLCDTCRATITQFAELFSEGEMPDSDDPEAPCNYVYDHRLFCGGYVCAHPPQVSDGTIMGASTSPIHNDNERSVSDVR